MYKKTFVPFLTFVSFLLFIACNTVIKSPEQAARSVFYVSKDGSNFFSGKLPVVNQDRTDGPFATIEKARETVRALKQTKGLPDGGITIYIREGEYVFAKTLEFTNQDSGSETAPIVYRCYKHERVKLIGGKEIVGFKPVVDQTILRRIEKPYQDRILQADLKAQGMTDYGEMKPRGFGRLYPAGLEVFFNDKPMQLARWPNHEWATIAAIPAAKNAGKFTYSGERPQRWQSAEEIWIHGYWTWDWADSYEKVKSINHATREISTYEPHGVYGYSAGKRYYALNILEELDEPGEWYLDRKTGILYFWPPTSLTKGTVYVSMLDNILQLKDVSYVTFQGLEIGICRGTAIEISGGDHNKIAGCIVRNIGNIAINIDGGKENGVISCDISECGDGAIVLSGGDRKTLTRGNNYAFNNHIHNYGRWVRTMTPGISVRGVGNRIEHNLIHSAPHIGILLHGNDHIIELNEIHHVCMESSDAGAFYMGRDYSERGNIIRYNYFHDLGTNGSFVIAIYLDDFASGTSVFGNVIYKAKRGVLIGGGRDNVIQNNIFVDCEVAVHLDARGLGWAKYYFDGTYPILGERLNEVKYKEPPFSIRYPELLTLYNENPAIPKGNAIINNIVYGEKWIDLQNGVDERVVTIQNNYNATEKDFVDIKKNNLQLKDGSPAYNVGFQHIPMAEIGLKQ